MEGREPTPEEIQAVLNQKLAKKAEAERIRLYKEKVKETDAANFRDKPDPIEFVRVINSFESSVILEWDKPCNNNEEVVLYNIYVSEEREVTQEDQLYQTEAIADQDVATYKVADLEPKKIYYVRVFAVNAIGEGYPAEQSTYVRTMDDALSEPGSLYVWGNNQSSELGLTDEQVEENKASYSRCTMRTAVKHSMFDGIVYDVAPGNVTTVFHCVNKDTRDTFIVMCGMTSCPKDGEEIE